MLTKRLQGCSILLLVFLLSNASGCAPETNIDTEAIVSEPEEVSLGSGYACDHADEGKRRSLATGSGLFCVAVQTADPTVLQAGLNWACGPGHADCSAIQPGGPCYKQNNLVALASYAYNDYYHRNANTGATCTFNGTAMTTPTDPVIPVRGSASSLGAPWREARTRAPRRRRTPLPVSARRRRSRRASAAGRLSGARPAS